MPRCSLCGKNEGDADKPESGGRLYVCGDCVAQANTVVEDDAGGERPAG